MKIAIIGTRGIPNHYGGFEQFAEYLAKGMVERGHEVTVYSSHFHPYQESEWQGVALVHCYSPEKKLGTAGQFLYDLNCIMHTRKSSYDIILQLGYTSSTVWGWLLPRRKSIITTNMDGLEWKRSKYSKPARAFLKGAEYLATLFSDHWISDSIGIQKYLKREYNLNSTYIPYGASPFVTPNPAVLTDYKLSPFGYNMLIARLEPENNVDVILGGLSQTAVKMPFLVIGKHETGYGEYLKNKYRNNENIQFLGGIYDINILDNLRYYSNLYFHGHSVGGTNPSLLEAMASQALICAHKNDFNAAILENDALYFETKEDIGRLIEGNLKSNYRSYIENNLKKIRNIYIWEQIIDAYERHFNSIYSKRKVG